MIVFQQGDVTMKHDQGFVADRAVKTAPDRDRCLRLSQTLMIALLCAVAAIAACAAVGASWLVCAVAAIATLNTVPLVLGIALAAR